jgi:hypothetical protein
MKTIGMAWWWYGGLGMFAERDNHQERKFLRNIAIMYILSLTLDSDSVFVCKGLGRLWF